MSCERHERDLALLVEGDLLPSDVPLIERHLATCAQCQMFERGLRSSQATLKSFAEDALPEHALAAAHARVLATVRTRPRPAWNTPRWAWIACASAVPVAVGVALVWLGGSVTPTPGPTVTQTEPRPMPTPQVATGLPLSPDSTKARQPAVSRNVQRPRHSHLDRLSPEDADQLTRALVLVSQLRREDGWRPAGEPVETAQTPLARIATDDPNVVIYWQFDPNGG
jgi:hypothetical protein